MQTHVQGQTPSIQQDRRQASRQRKTRTPGWLFFDNRSRQVDVHDIAAGGVGLTSDLPIDAGTQLKIRVGLGSTLHRLPRCAVVAHCVRLADGRFRIGLNYTDAVSAEMTNAA